MGGPAWQGMSQFQPWLGGEAGESPCPDTPQGRVPPRQCLSTAASLLPTAPPTGFSVLVKYRGLFYFIKGFLPAVWGDEEPGSKCELWGNGLIKPTVLNWFCTHLAFRS